jgi:uncharacterized repeat protein (TIGR01451 family)
MRRGLLIALSLSLMLASVFGMTHKTDAHPVSINSTTTEWTNFGRGPSSNLGHIIRNTQGQGVFAWTDEANDQRTLSPTELLTNTREVDIRTVMVTGDPQNLSVYVKMSGITRVETARPDTDLPQIQIAIDTNGSSTGNSALVAPATASPTVAARWEYLLRTQFDDPLSVVVPNVSNTSPMRVYANPGSFVTTGLSVLNNGSNDIELQVPWSSIGLAGPPSEPLRFTVVSLRSSGTVPVSTTLTTNILDTITPAIPAGPTGVANTENELSDNVIDYSFEVRFENGTPVSSSGLGEVYSPLLVSEVGLFPRSVGNPNVGDTKIQWMEITNVSDQALTAAQVGSYKIGDVPQRNSNESMLRLPSVGIGAHESIIITRDKTRFTTVYSTTDGTKVFQTTGLTPAGNWATGADISLRVDRAVSDAQAISDQIVLLDGSDTIVDMVEYSNIAITNAYADHLPVSVPHVTASSGLTLTLPLNLAIQRCDSSRDTNNRDAANPDWLVIEALEDQTPLGDCLFTDLAIGIDGPQGIVVNAATDSLQDYTISYNNYRGAASNVIIRNLLPEGMSFEEPVGSSPTPTVSVVGGRTQLQWTLGALPARGQGTISFKTRVLAATPAGDSSHDLSIQSNNREINAEQANNQSSLAVSYSTEPVADVKVTKSLVTTGENESNLYPGGRAVYRVLYSNVGTKAATNVTLVDTIPAGLVYFGNSKGWLATQSSGKVAFSVPGTLGANGGSGEVDLIFAISETLGEGSSIAANSITIGTTTTPEIASNNTALSQPIVLNEKPPMADLEVKVSLQAAPNPVPGSELVYVVNYSNKGSNDAFAVSILSSFSNVLEYQSNSANLQADTSIGGQVKFTIPPLVQNATGSFQVVFKIKDDAPAGSKASNLLTISTSSAEGPITNNSAIASEVEVKAKPSTTPTTPTVPTTPTTPTTEPTRPTPGTEEDHNVYLPLVRK